MPKRDWERKHATPIAAEYLAELRERVEAAGIVAVAKAAKMSRKTVWRALGGDEGRLVTLDAVERVREALETLDPHNPLPSPVVAVKGRAHGEWVKLADKLTATELEAVAADPTAVLQAARSKRRK